MLVCAFASKSSGSRQLHKNPRFKNNSISQPNGAVLLDDQHSPCRGVIARAELIVIGAACDRFSVLVAAIPMRGTRFVSIDARYLMSYIERADNVTALVIYAQGNVSIVCQVERYPGFGVERIWIILQQRRAFDVFQGRDASFQRFHR